MAQNKKVSVIIPAYNAEKTIGKLLNALGNQTYSKEDLEVIIVNDGSIDATKDICSNFCATHSNFTLINKQNGGVSSARNVGLKYATGEYVTFFDSDDICANDIIEKMAKTMDQTGCDLVCCGIAEKSGGQVEKYGFKGNTLFDLKKDKDTYVKFFNAYWLPVVWNKLYKRDLITQGFVEGISYDEDTIFNLNYMEKVHKVACLKDDLYTYTKDSSASLTNKGLKNIFEKSRTTNPYRINLSKQIFNDDACVWVACRKLIKAIFQEVKYKYDNKCSKEEIINTLKERMQDEEVLNSFKHYKELTLQDAVIKDLFLNKKYKDIVVCAVNGFGPYEKRIQQQREEKCTK